MASTLTLQLEMNDWPDPPRLEVLGRVDRTTRIIAVVRLHEPITTAGLAAIFRTIVRTWIEPELSADSEQALSDYLDCIGTRTL